MSNKDDAESIIGYSIDGLKNSQVKAAVYKQIQAKMRIEKIKNFSEQEINRVFDNVVSPTYCKKQVNQMIKDGLTITDLYAGVEYMMAEN